MSTRPNVVVIVADTARASAVTEKTSPTLTQLRESGVDYVRAFTSAPWTLPSHAGVFTAMCSSKHGAHAGHKQLSINWTTLAEAFSHEKFETVSVSNNTWISGEFGFERGFDTFRKNWQYVQSDVDLGEIARTKEGLDKLKAVSRRIFDGNPLVNVANTVYGKFLRKRNDDGAQSTNDWVWNWLQERDDSDPFFLFINYLEPHLEYHPPREHANRFLPSDISYDEAMEVNQDAWAYIAGNVEMTQQDFEILRALYRAEISYLDKRISELQEMLQAAGEWDDTIFVVTGDHGENIGDHGLMDHQYCLYDTLIHVPLVITGGAFEGGQTVHNMVQLTDLGPTLLDAAGIEAPEFRAQAQGRSFHPDADTEEREYVFAEYLAPQPSMNALEKRVGELSEDVSKYDRSLRTIRGRKWKLIRGSDGTKELYDVEDDPGETKDLSNKRPEEVAELESELDDWLDSFEHADVDGDVDMSEETAKRLEDLGYLQ